MEKLHALADSKDSDWIVDDTPPTRHALAFLDAPRLLTRLLENRVYRLLMAPRGLVRAVNSAAHARTRTIGCIDDSATLDYDTPPAAMILRSTRSCIHCALHQSTGVTC